MQCETKITEELNTNEEDLITIQPSGSTPQINEFSPKTDDMTSNNIKFSINRILANTDNDREKLAVGARFHFHPVQSIPSYLHTDRSLLPPLVDSFEHHPIKYENDETVHVNCEENDSDNNSNKNENNDDDDYDDDRHNVGEYEEGLETELSSSKSRLDGSQQIGSGCQSLSWLQCTRYKPPKLPSKLKQGNNLL